MPKSVICDMDGVIYRGNELIPGAVEFVEQLQGDTSSCFLPATQAYARI